MTLFDLIVELDLIHIEFYRMQDRMNDHMFHMQGQIIMDLHTNED